MITLDDEWAIDSDGEQYILGRMREFTDKKLGRTVSRLAHPTYYSTLREAASGYARRKQREMVHQEDMTLDAAVIALSAVERGIAEMVRGAVRESVTIGDT